MRRYLFLVSLFLLALAPKVWGISAAVSHSVFRNNRGVAEIEVYWEVVPSSLHYQRDSTGKISTRIRTQLRIICDTGIVYDDKYWLRTTPFDPQVQDAGRILELRRIAVPEGRLRIALQLAEERHPESVYYQDSLSIAPLAGVEYSSLQLLDTFFSSTTPSPFLKQGYQCIPRALDFYDEGQRQVSCYFELYGAIGPIIQTVWIARSAGGQPVVRALRDSITGIGSRQVFRRMLSTATLPSGNYYLNVSVRAASGGVLATKSRYFQTLNRQPEEAAPDTSSTRETEKVEGDFLDLNATFVSKFNAVQLRAVLRMLEPAATKADAAAIGAFLRNPDELYMRYFIYNYFAALDHDNPGRAWRSFSESIREVNRRFTRGGTQGYETDRGRIYLRYGPPAEEVSVPAEAGAQPYEIWRYNAGGRLMAPGLFLFYESGSSGYKLLHSTVPGERREPQWRTFLYSTGHSSGNLNSRAEEFFGNQR